MDGSDGARTVEWDGRVDFFANFRGKRMIYE